MTMPSPDIVPDGEPLPPSLWAATAPAAPPTPALRESIATDVLVIGGGYTGLSTALHLAERGTGVTVLEANDPGWGASGRNGGQVNPTLKHDPDELVRMLGAARAEPLIDAVSRSADLVFDLIGRHGIDCQPVRAGWLQLSYSDKAVPARSYCPAAGSAPRCASSVGAASAALGRPYQALSQAPSTAASSALPPSSGERFIASSVVLFSDSGRPSLPPVRSRPWLEATTTSQFSSGWAARRSATCLSNAP
ncbi:NAD(P)/FAD-dependent oxidoreductase, partial [Ralstonia pseudosolanacearum]|uniref:NAD(P)/FAD-dependent oxidoreductase n=1 Tax=Ralstonia pseudosolanacearum TaxID=1310165 RepID=UPI003D27F18E